ncbi:MAG: Ig-like domain-containing protein [Planctomycetota bacterium]
MRAISTIILGFSLCLCACGGYGPTGPGPSKAGFQLTEVDAPAGDPVALDGTIVFRFTEAVDESSLQDGSIVIETAGGVPARGTFVRGTFLADPTSGTTVVVDADQLDEDLIDQAERAGDPSMIPVEVRYDLGETSPLNGSRRVLFDRSRRNFVTFIPDVPVLADLSDAAYDPATTYRVLLPVEPSPLALQSVFDRALSSEGGLPYEESFTTKDLGDPGCFLQEGTLGTPAVVNISPVNEGSNVTADAEIRLRFSRPLDPASVGPDAFSLEIASVAGRPAVPFAVALQQTPTGLVEVVLLPLQSLSPDETYEVGARDGIRDLAGRLLPFGFTSSFATGSFPPPGSGVSESFDTQDMMDVANTTASWGTDVAGELTAQVGDAQESVAQSGWFDQTFATPDYGTPVVDSTLNGGTIEVYVQGSREDVNVLGNQPIDPDLDPLRTQTTDWVAIDEIDVLDDYQYLRFRVVLTTEADGATTGRVPTVRGIDIPLTTDP